MLGNSESLVKFLEGSKVRFIIPVYQRKYEWKTENCTQLYKDLCRISADPNKKHFFGSVVSNVVTINGNYEHHIIDGQQRITTIMLMLLAMYKLLDEGKLQCEEEFLKEEIYETFLIAKFNKGDERYRLVPVESDREAYHKLFGKEEEYDRSSNLTINYFFFYNLFLRKEISLDDLYSAINRLEIINITLEHNDNAQLIFESLNSTGLALEEGDKIRNYVLMGQDPDTQNRYFDDYWKKIEACTQNKVSDFVRDFLSIIEQSTPNISNVYPAFKQYVERNEFDIEPVLEELLKYARYYEKLLTCKCGLGYKELDDCLYRLKRLETVVARPFFMEVMRLNADKKISTEDLVKIFLVTENYLFRRNICEVPTNALNKVFVTINKEVLRYDNTTDNYLQKFVYTLESKKETGRFPDDEEFASALETKQIYLMRGRFKNYLFERFENYGTVEVKDVFTLLDNNTYSIEHIMPQHLTPEWQENLGPNYQEIHEEWLHRLANLTLTGYNPNLSNKTFLEKRDNANGGYKTSGIRMNQLIAQNDEWGLKQLQERNDRMVNKALQIWSYPATDYMPPEKEYETCSLDDEDIDLTGRDLVKYSYRNNEHIVNSWADMVEQVIGFLHQQDKSVLTGIAFEKNDSSTLRSNITNDPSELRKPLKIDENIYFERNTSTAFKTSLLRQLFAAYHADPMDLVFFLKDEDAEDLSDDGIKQTRKKYWEYALPMIQKENADYGAFSNCTPASYNSVAGSFGIGGFNVSCIANTNQARVDFYLGSRKQTKNKRAFDVLYIHKSEIENEMGMPLVWERANDNKASWIFIKLNDVNVMDQNDWERMAEFHTKYSRLFLDACLPYLNEEFYGQEENDKIKKLISITASVKNWAEGHKEIRIDDYKNSKTYIRFRTDYMDKLIPDTENNMSGWNTGNHYFYEIRNMNGKTLYIQLAFSSKNIIDEQRNLTERIYKSSTGKDFDPKWEYLIPFKTQKKHLDETASEESVYQAMDECMNEIMSYEKELASKI